jgi:hypothetical protein
LPTQAALQDKVSHAVQTRLAHVGRLTERHPEHFGPKQHSIVHRLVRALRTKDHRSILSRTFARHEGKDSRSDRGARHRLITLFSARDSKVVGWLKKTQHMRYELAVMSVRIVGALLIGALIGLERGFHG